MNLLRIFLVLFLVGSIAASPLLIHISSVPLALFLLGMALGPPKVRAHRHVRGNSVVVQISAMGLGALRAVEKVGARREHTINVWVIGRRTVTLSYMAEDSAVVGPLVVVAFSLAGTRRKAEVLGEAIVRPPTASRLMGANSEPEFDHVRRYVPGDRPRAINWKATARTGTPMVNIYKPSSGTLPIYAPSTQWGKAKLIAGALRRLGIPAEVTASPAQGAGGRAVHVVDLGLGVTPTARQGHVVVDVLPGSGGLDSALEAASRRPIYRTLEGRGVRVVVMFPMDSPMKVALAIAECLSS